MKFLKQLYSIIFSRFLMASLALAVQVMILLILTLLFKDYIFVFFGGYALVGIMLTIYIINDKENPAFKMSWIVLVLVFPLYGALIYLYAKTQLSNRVIRERLNVQHELTKDLRIQKPLALADKQVANYIHYMNQMDGYGAYDNCKATYFPLGEDKWPDLLAELEKAQNFIFMEYFIIAKGKMWDNILEILIRKAQAGVDVRLMYDGTCSITTLPFNYCDELIAHGIQAKQYAPLKPLISTHYNNRDHRKICVVDGRVAYTGGINLADEYINAYQKHGHWKDTAVKLEGDVVNSFTLMFLEMWCFDHKEKEDYAKYLIRHDVVEKGIIMGYGDNPLDNVQVGEFTYLEIINTATEYVHITSPYLIIDNELILALQNAARKGIDVKLILPHIPDKKPVYLLGTSYYRELIECGVQIFEYTPGFIHAKMFTSDDIKATVGTINLDYRSLYLHFECGAYFYDHPIIETIEKDFQKTLELSQAITLKDLKHPLWKRAFISILRLFAPLM